MKTTRWLDLLAYLLNRRTAATRDAIFTHVKGYGTGESARRKFERDKDELRELGIEIETVPLGHGAGDEANAGYRLRHRDFYLPYFELAGESAPARPYPGVPAVHLSTDEAGVLDRATRALAERGTAPLAAAARSLRRKLAFDLPVQESALLKSLGTALDPGAMNTLRLLQEAVTRHRAVRCRYYAIARDADEERVIEPYGLFFTWGLWYCVARARDRDALRVFRLERMRDADLLSDAFIVPADFTIRDYVGRRPWELGGNAPVTAVVRFRFPEARWVLAQRVGETVDDTLPDGGATIAFTVREPNPFLRWLLTFRDQATVLDPPHLRNDLRALRLAVARLYEDA